jgi:hypothetical protein
MVAGRVDPAEKSSRLVLLGEGPENDTGAPAGAFEACNAGECVRVNRPGFGTSIDGPNAPPTRPFAFSREELDELTQAVSDPEGWVATATGGESASPDVAAGPDDEETTAPAEEAGVEVTERGDARSPSEVSGIADASGAESGDTVMERLGTLEGLETATADAAQYEKQTVDVNGVPVELPDDCTDPASCFGDTFEPIPLPEEFTTVDQLATLGGLGTASYSQGGLPLINTNGVSDGSYDFSLVVDLGARSASLDVSNLNSTILGLSGSSFGQVTDYSSYPLGFNVPATFGAFTTIVSGLGPCVNGCDAGASAALVNGNGRIADGVIHAVVVTVPSGGGPVVGTVSGSSATIRRP